MISWFLLGKLFISYLKIGFFGLGGGYAMLALIEHEIVQVNSWLNSVEFIDIIALAEVTPGSLAINAATFTGYRVAGVAGAAAATLGVICPSLLMSILIMRILDHFTRSRKVQQIFAGLHPAAIALIGLAAISVGKSAIIDLPGALFALGCFSLILFTSFHPLLFIGAGVIFGLLFYR